MKICFFTRTTLAHSMGGMEVHTDLLVKGLAALGHEIYVITTGHPQGGLIEESSGVKTFYVKGTKPGKYSRQWSTRSTQTFFQLNQQEKFDIILSESGGAFHLLQGPIYKKLRLPVVVILHGIFYNELKTRLNLGLSLKNMIAALYFIMIYVTRDFSCIRKATAVIATSHEQERLIKKFYFIPDHKVFTVFNGIETTLTQKDDALKSKLGFQSEDKLIVCAARLKKEKGIHLLLEALPYILRRVPRAKVLIIGDGEYRQTLEILSQQLGVEKYVKFTGFVPYAELGAYFHLAEVFVNSTIRENGYDLTIIQAMAYGKTVVVSRLQSLQGVIESGENGFLVPRGDVRRLAEVVSNVLKDEKLRQIVGEKAREKALRSFSVDHMVQATEDVLKKCLSNTFHTTLRN